ncbi:hypothetical protein BEP19_04840 [Ammoniphilus oxalaticus]|uniref:Uncharacterized protein n=2 Tax=Ammoniphilus oxalaticus TaxID=66863 RepID=A0A419SIH4_9BACL|nr:hypothetical protein BEP19_04840 [Ammoniphilus oxalaticus]
MLKAGDRAFFYEQIYRHEQSVVDDYTITVHAYVHPLYMEALQEKELSNLEQADLKLSFSVCRFFVEGKGCSLHPAYKTSTCRSFICSTIEEQLTDQQCSELSHRVRQIREEVRAFEVVHQAKLKQKNWTLSSQLEPILDYLEAVK